VDECGDFKFGKQIDHSKAQPMDDTTPQKWTLLRHMTHFYFCDPGMDEARVVKSYKISSLTPK